MSSPHSWLVHAFKALVSHGHHMPKSADPREHKARVPEDVYVAAKLDPSYDEWLQAVKDRHGR